MKRLWLFLVLACGAPTDSTDLMVPGEVDQLRIVHPRTVVVTMTPVEQSVYPDGTAQYIAIARDGQGRELRASAWVWTTSDTTIAVVSQTGLATGLTVGQVTVYATAYPPWRR